VAQSIAIPGTLALIPGGTLLTDAGGNSLLRIADDGTISTVATFCVTPARRVYANRTGSNWPWRWARTGLITSENSRALRSLPGAAQIYRITPGGTQTVFATGFTMITDLVFGLDGTLYALEYDSNGLRNPGSAGALLASAGGRLQIPHLRGPHQSDGVAIGSDGAFYVSNFGASSARGQVVRISVPEPQTYACAAGSLCAMFCRNAPRAGPEQEVRRRLPGRSSIRRADDSIQKLRLVLLAPTEYRIPLRAA
jgi:hypothetical protein